MTFLFTDVEGSTRLWEHDPASMRGALERHDQVLRAAVAAHGGTVFATGGDGFAVAFARAADGLAAAVAAQAELAADDGAVPIRVRMGIHTGEAIEREGDYFGPAVNRAARLMAAAHGGQVLCSAVTAGLAAEGLPEGCVLADLGVHRLRDLSAPEHIHQLSVAGWRDEFPPIRSLDAFPGNLPVQATGFVGREEDLREVLKTLTEARVVTLTGVGGVGKTRLALQVAAEALPRFRDGAWLVDLAGVGSPDAVPGSVASALGVQASPGTSVAASIEAFVRSQELLLLLDNCEHLLATVAELVEAMVQVAPHVRVLATSREGLGVRGEFVRAVPSLDLPRRGSPVETVASASSVRLFVERARQASTTFEFGADEAEPIAELCRRLDGIPLAIELAAARVPAMTPAEITAHLDRRFRLLTGGRRSAVSRHQTLRSTIDWSYQLLEPDEQVVLDRLAVFAGNFDLAAAEAVAADDVIDRFDVLDVLVRLVAKSLLVAEPRGATTRYRLLETVRDYAWERLQTLGEVDDVSRRHAEHYAALAREAGSGLRGSREVEWRDWIEGELDNLRAALAWAIAAGDVQLALEPINDLAVFGSVLTPYGLLPERAGRLAKDHPLAAVALGAACCEATLQGDLDAARRLADEAHRLAAALDRTPEGLRARCRVASATCMVAGMAGDALEALAHEWLADARELDDEFELCEALTLMVSTHDPGEALAAGEEAIVLARRMGAPSRIAYAAVFLASRVGQHDPERGKELLQEAAAAAAIAHNDWVDISTAMALTALHATTGDEVSAVETALSAADRAIGASVSGNLIVFVSAIACLFAKMGDQEGALVLAAWVEAHGSVVQLGSYAYDTYGVAELNAARVERTPAELERLARNATSLDGTAALRFARERLSQQAT